MKIALLVFLLILRSGIVYAATDEDRASAARLLDEGNQLFEAKKFSEALAKYQEAHATFPSPKIFFNIGEAMRELGRPVEAANAYASFIAEANVEPTSPIGVKAREELEKLDHQVARLSFEGDLEGTAIVVDEEPVDRLVRREVRVSPGSHKIRAAREGLEPFDTMITARAGASTPVTIELSETPPIRDRPQLIAEAPRKAPATEEGLTSKWYFWTAVGGAAVLAVVVTAVAATSGGDDRLPMGELPSTSTADWMRF